MKSSRCSSWKQQASYLREPRWRRFPFNVPPRFHPRSCRPHEEYRVSSLWAEPLLKDTLIMAWKQQITELAYCCDLTDLLLQSLKNQKPPVKKWFPALVVGWGSPWTTHPGWKPPWASTGLHISPSPSLKRRTKSLKTLKRSFFFI